MSDSAAHVAPPIDTLGRAARDFFSRRVTWQRIAPAAITAAARWGIRRDRPFAVGDAVAAVAAVAAYGPFEWVGHHWMLHGLPLGPLPERRHTEGMRFHLEHHRNADDVEFLFEPLPIVPVVVGASTVAALLARRRNTLALTGLATFQATMAVYHWIHYLMHVPYVPRSRWLRRIEDNHMSHHRTGEGDWHMGVMFDDTDRVLGALGVGPARRDRQSVAVGG